MDLQAAILDEVKLASSDPASYQADKAPYQPSSMSKPEESKANQEPPVEGAEGDEGSAAVGDALDGAQEETGLDGQPIKE